ncbi:hypothetical protein RWV98_16495 [Agathobaculum sp. NTUH-O15-33]|uniref:hypothetical protein n=1 Tax=Agathobaculum sp. NTUH-O15-33 TaxID=3079302 RepID=UPI0029587C8D|nr:hypothetical protein [Agathobaculum sp. NTUH-O15-33]WNX84153.1 hypothetical protein RWV98_16495 [Agathobaculum sp. NTUH-O15-33]
MIKHINFQDQVSYALVCFGFSRAKREYTFLYDSIPLVLNMGKRPDEAWEFVAAKYEIIKFTVRDTIRLGINHSWELVPHMYAEINPVFRNRPPSTYEFYVFFNQWMTRYEVAAEFTKGNLMKMVILQRKPKRAKKELKQ